MPDHKTSLETEEPALDTSPPHTTPTNSPGLSSQKLPATSQSIEQDDDQAVGSHHAQAQGDGGKEPGEPAVPEPPEAAWEYSNDLDSALIRNKTASLYCVVSTYPHTTLLSFGIEICPLCRQDLTRTTRLQLPVRVSTSEASSVCGELDGDGADKKHLIQHAIEYRDAGDQPIFLKDWDKPFNLQQERLRALAKDKQRIVLRVVTVVRSSVPNESRWYRHEQDQLERDMPLLSNPKYTFTLSSVKLVVCSRHVIGILRDVCTYNTKFTYDAVELTLEEPYSIIGHHVDQLEAKLKDLAPKEGDYVPSDRKAAYEDLDLVLEHVKAIYQDRIEVESSRHILKTSPMCTFRMLWLLFKPGMIVYMDLDGKEQAYIVERLEIDDAIFSRAFEDLKPYRILLWNLDFDGHCVRRRWSWISMQPFSSERPITSLQVVPSQFFDTEDGGELCGRLEARGKAWYTLLKGSQVNYKGEIVSDSRRRLNGRAFVDSASYYELHEYPDFGEDIVRQDGENWKDPFRVFDGIRPSVLQSLQDLPKPPTISFNPYLICANYVKAYVFSTRTWETLDVAFCEHSKKNITPFERLIMPEEQKLMIKALVYKYADHGMPTATQNRPGVQTLFRRKARARSFSSMGDRALAKHTMHCWITGRPLLAITSGDLGTDENDLEANLGKWLRLAYKWGAVMLLDEADVFLESRMEADLKRNSLVSVFLRELEYYQGILFLTTNRVGHFDDAFISRIHVVIHYRDLSKDYRKRIWNQFFDKLQKEKGNAIKIEPSVRRYVLGDGGVYERKLNGREIRNGKLKKEKSGDVLWIYMHRIQKDPISMNHRLQFHFYHIAFQTAVALAEYRFLTKSPMEKDEDEVAVLAEKDFKQVCDLAESFKEYLKGPNSGEDEAQRARRRQWRN